MTQKQLAKELKVFKRIHHVDAVGTMHMSYRQVNVEMYVEREVIYLGLLFVNDYSRSKGHGSRALRNICTWADKHGITVTLIAGPFDKCPLTKRKLREWYRSFGFKGMKYNLTRHPITN